MIKINIVPQASKLNRGDWRKMEDELRQALKEGKSVNVKIDIVYPSTGEPRPNEFKISAIVDGEPLAYKFKQ